MTTKELGDLGEKLACEYLVKKGYNILERNYRISFGEIDVICRKRWGLFKKNDKTIHFVEVKTIMAQDGFFPEERVDFAKQRKLKQLCQIWLEKKHFPQDIPYQIDIIGVSVNETTGQAKLAYFPNAVEDSKT